jgi:formaldehyde-activating enzyme involved in methanogenesis
VSKDTNSRFSTIKRLNNSLFFIAWYNENMKKPNLDSKPAQYYLARKAGKNKKQSAIIAGYSQSVAEKAVSQIEESMEFKTIERYFKDELKSHITISEIASALADNIRQEGMKVIDRGSRNKAIEIALSKLEPDNKNLEQEERVILVVK